MIDVLVILLNTLNSLQPLAVIGLLGLVIFLLVKNNRQVDTIKTNDLHEVPAILETLQRIEVKLGEEFSWIRAKLNGGSSHDHR